MCCAGLVAWNATLVATPHWKAGDWGGGAKRATACSWTQQASYLFSHGASEFFEHCRKVLGRPGHQPHVVGPHNLNDPHLILGGIPIPLARHERPKGSSTYCTHLLGDMGEQLQAPYFCQDTLQAHLAGRPWSVCGTKNARLRFAQMHQMASGRGITRWTVVPRSHER